MNGPFRFQVKMFPKTVFYWLSLNINVKHPIFVLILYNYQHILTGFEWVEGYDLLLNAFLSGKQCI